METNHFRKNENRDQDKIEELLRFTGKRLPEYTWLQGAFRTNKTSNAGQGRYSEKV